ncbi:MAG: type II toxin-antitoxin system PemK/MazF family toxin [Myxococcales bacterium]|nr:type II toxin-antitoxin system PemK/MazF family toxin [Myxococcales bacterium]
MRRNELYWANLGGDAGRRPVLVVSRTEVNAVRRKVIVAEVTTRARGTTAEIRLGRAEGLPRASVVNLENLHTIPKQWLDRRIGALRRATIARVDDALRFALELP